MKQIAAVLLAAGIVIAQPVRPPKAETDVMQLDEAYRLAKLNRDTQALERILADGFNETNQNGNSRNKAQTIELWKTFAIPSLTTDSYQVQVAGDTARVTGAQTEGTERMLFTRVYLNGQGGWKLLDSIQFRNPNPGSSGSSGLPSVAVNEVRRAEEVYRLAKLNRDTQALDRILADGFNETNQNGNSRNKSQTLELWKSFGISSLTTDSSQVRIAGDTASVTGAQTENGTEKMLFTRVYVNGPRGWQLLASTQFRDPKVEQAGLR